MVHFCQYRVNRKRGGYFLFIPDPRRLDYRMKSNDADLYHSINRLKIYIAVDDTNRAVGKVNNDSYVWKIIPGALSRQYFIGRCNNLTLTCPNSMNSPDVVKLFYPEFLSFHVNLLYSSHSNHSPTSPGKFLAIHPLVISPGLSQLLKEVL